MVQLVVGILLVSVGALSVHAALVRRERRGQSRGLDTATVSGLLDIDRLSDAHRSDVGHELRTPLTSIRAALQLVLADKPTFKDPEHEQLLDVALQNCERLTRTINKLLDPPPPAR